MATQFILKTKTLTGWHMLLTLTSKAKAGAHLTSRGQPEPAWDLVSNKTKKTEDCLNLIWCLNCSLCSFLKQSTQSLFPFWINCPAVILYSFALWRKVLGTFSLTVTLLYKLPCTSGVLYHIQNKYAVFLITYIISCHSFIIFLNLEWFLEMNFLSHIIQVLTHCQFCVRTCL